LNTPGAKNAYVWLNVGEVPMLLYASEHFIRFSSKLVSRDKVTPYLEAVYFIARKYFPNKVKFLVDGASTSLIMVLDKISGMKEKEEGCHNAEDVYKAIRKMKGLQREEQGGKHK